MRVTRSERLRAEGVSAAVDQLLQDRDARPEHVDPRDSALISTARSLAHLPAALGPVDPAFEDRLMRRLKAQATDAPVQRKRGLRPVWAAVAAAVALVVVFAVTPWGQTALASFMAVFDLGRTEVRITPADVPSQAISTAEVRGTTVQQEMTLDAAREQIPFTILLPSYLPPGYRLQKVIGYTYPDLPAWMPQPFSAELIFAQEHGKEVSMRIYPISLGTSERTSILSALNLEVSPIQSVQDVDVDGRPGVLLQLGPDGAAVAWHEVVWEQADLVVTLSTADLLEPELLRMAGSVQ